MIHSTKPEFRNRGSNIPDDISISRIETIQRHLPRTCKFTKEGPQVIVFAEVFELEGPPDSVHVYSVVEVTPHMSGPSLADKRTVDKSTPTRTVILIFIGDVLEDLDFKLCRNTPRKFFSGPDGPVCMVNCCRSSSEMMRGPCYFHKIRT